MHTMRRDEDDNRQNMSYCGLLWRGTAGGSFCTCWGQLQRVRYEWAQHQRHQHQRHQHQRAQFHRGAERGPTLPQPQPPWHRQTIARTPGMPLDMTCCTGECLDRRDTRAGNVSHPRPDFQRPRRHSDIMSMLCLAMKDHRMKTCTTVLPAVCWVVVMLSAMSVSAGAGGNGVRLNGVSRKGGSQRGVGT